jgi:hypothetical protein
MARSIARESGLHFDSDRHARLQQAIDQLLARALKRALRAQDIVDLRFCLRRRTAPRAHRQCQPDRRAAIVGQAGVIPVFIRIRT